MTASPTREAWTPATQSERDAVLQELQSVLASAHFCNSKRYPALLRYVVEAKLAGKADLLKERTIGVDVFERPPTYDTNADTVVRYTAGEVRKRLSAHYHEVAFESPIHISLPTGSYIPVFLVLSEAAPHDQPAGLGQSSGLAAQAAGLRPGEGSLTQTQHDISLSADLPQTTLSHVLPGPNSATSIPGNDAVLDRSLPHAPRAASAPVLGSRAIATLFLILLAGAIAFGIWSYRAVHPVSALDQFWAPLLHEKKAVMIATGGVVFDGSRYSGVVTAGKETEYPFLSMQIAAGIARVTGILDRSGEQYELQFAASTPLSEMRERPSILLGGYNNVWTLRFTDGLRFHFSPETTPSIIDRQHPENAWVRDQSIAYSSTDDYALVGRFRDPTTDGWVLVLAGLGRNGSEAAAQFVTTPHYMDLLRDQLGGDLSGKNLEVVLKVRVIDGKTGAPSIQAVHSW